MTKRIVILLFLLGFIIAQGKEKTSNDIGKETDKEYIMDLSKLCGAFNKKLGFLAKFVKKSELPISITLSDTTGEPLKDWRTILQFEKEDETYEIYLYSTEKGKIKFGISLGECSETKVRLIIPKNDKKKINIKVENIKIKSK